jgi:hypothetical protein
MQQSPEKLTGSELVKNSLHFMEPEDSLPYTQVSATFFVSGS